MPKIKKKTKSCKGGSISKSIAPKRDARWWPSIQLEDSMKRVIEEQINKPKNMEKVKDVVRELIKEQLLDFCGAIKHQYRTKKRKNKQRLESVPEISESGIEI